MCLGHQKSWPDHWSAMRTAPSSSQSKLIQTFFRYLKPRIIWSPGRAFRQLTRPLIRLAWSPSSTTMPPLILGDFIVRECLDSRRQGNTISNIESIQNRRKACAIQSQVIEASCLSRHATASFRLSAFLNSSSVWRRLRRAYRIDRAIHLHFESRSKVSHCLLCHAAL